MEEESFSKVSDVHNSVMKDLAGLLCVLQGVANRDIKLENTLLDGTTRPLIKICDFGYSKVCLISLFTA